MLTLEYRGNTYRQINELDAWVQQHQEPALEPALAIVDAHHHLWDDTRGRYLSQDLGTDIDNGGHNIIATVFVEAGAMYRSEDPAATQPLGEVEFASEIARSNPVNERNTRLCAGIVGHADLTLGDQVRPVLEALIDAGRGRLRGIRQGVAWDAGDALKFARQHAPRYRLLDPAFRKGFTHLKTLGLSFDAWQFHLQSVELIELLHAFEETNVILDHCGGLIGVAPHDGKQDELFKLWRAHITKLAQFPLLSVKLGGLGMVWCGWDFHAREAPPTSDELARVWRPYIETCIDKFGPQRCMMESNFPVDKQTCGYGVLWNAMKKITHGYSISEKAALYRGTASQVYRLVV